MLRDILSNRFFMGALAFFVLIVVGGTLYLKHVERQMVQEMARTEAAIKRLTEKQSPTAKAPIGDALQGGHWHGDEWHADPHAPVEPPGEAPVAVPPKTEPHPYDALSAEEQEAYRQRSIAITLEYLPEKLELEKASRDTLKRSYESSLNTLKYFEEQNLQRERHFYDTSRLKERIARLKAQLDMHESVIYHLKKWRDEHAKK